VSFVRRSSSIAFAIASLVAACDSSSSDASVDVVDPSDPSKHVTVTKSTVDLCNVMCDAMIADYHVPETERAACGYQCAEGFAATPDACYELVSCLHDTNICANGDVTPDCQRRAGACLDHWAVPNGLCRGCWKPNRTITGIRAFRDTTGGNTTNVIPVDLSADGSVAASFPTPNGYLPFAGTGAADGTFSIPEVPGCGTWVRVQTSWYWATSDAVDLTDPLTGRADVATAGPSTEIDVDATGLAPWHGEASVELVAPSNAAFAVHDFGLGELPDGTTTATVVYGWEGNPHFTTADKATLVQYSPYDTPFVTSTNVPLIRALTIGAIEPFATADGTTTHASVAMAPVTADHTTHFTLDRPAFFAALPEMALSTHPPRHPQQEWNADIHGTFTGAGGYGATVDLAVVFGLRASPGPVDLGTITFPNPLPADWELRGTIQFDYPTPLSADGITIASYPGAPESIDYRIVNELRCDSTLADFEARTVKPVIPEPANLRIGGDRVRAHPDGDGTEVLSQGAGPTPTIEWDPPAYGAAQSYTLIFHSFATPSKMVQIRTTDTTVRVPPDTIDPAHAYYFILLTESAADGPRQCTVRTVSGVIRP
jgi:hypothetical protein